MQYGSHVVHTHAGRGGRRSGSNGGRCPLSYTLWGAEADGRKAASRSSVCRVFPRDIRRREFMCVVCDLASPRRSSFFLFRVAPSRARAGAAPCAVRERASVFRTLCLSISESRLSPVRSAVSPSALRPCSRVRGQRPARDTCFIYGNLAVVRTR